RRGFLDGRATLFGVTLDVTRRKRAEEALRSADERAALATRSAGIGTWETSLVEADERWDAQMYRLRGIAPRDRPPSREERLAMLHPDDRALVFDSRPDARTHAGVARYEFRVRWPDGSERWIASRSMAVLDDTGLPIRRVGVNWDITESKLAEAARQESALAQQESRAKSQFLSRVSHELRTPLNAVLGFTQLMQAEDSLRAADKERLALIRSAGEHLLALINDMLDLTALDTGEMKLDPRPVSIPELVAETLPLVEPMAAQHEVTLRTEGLEGIVLADRTRLRQVLINLLTNAIKYNRPQGSVAIGTRHAGQHPTIEVSDTGRGLTQDQLAHLFEPFNRLGAESDAVEGSGIGLVIVKTFVERMGGKVAVDSEPGRGTRFRVTLPGATWAGAAREPARLPAEAGLQAADAGTHAARGRLLYIEDNAVNVLLVRELVTRRPGIEMLSAADGSQGVALALAQRPELVLIDMQLPDFDGFEVLHRLRAAPDGASLRCIALSANALPQDIERALAAGFADYWTKPIDFDRFLAGIDAAFGVAPRAG
ncbi:MAG TPA: ATP-binding protein, partial [Burkholderiaceae bacterium]|nr:ATP-binding protein [Burkholderiaceae bacterium]